MSIFYMLQKKSNKNIYYKEKRGKFIKGSGYPVILQETTDPQKATKFRSIDSISKSLEKVFLNSRKSDLPDLSDGFNVVKSETVILTKNEDNVERSLSSLMGQLKLASIMINNTHYSTIELFNKIRSDPALSDHKFILSTPYDRLTTSRLNDLFVGHGLEPIKHKGNFAFDREDYWTAAKILCDVQYKSFNMAEYENS